MNLADRERFFEDFSVGERIGEVAYSLTPQRLVAAAGSNRDFNAIHFDSVTARQSGAADIYANNIFLLGMWERAAREFAGRRAVIMGVSSLSMRGFNCTGEIVVVHGEVSELLLGENAGTMRLKMWSTNGERLTVGPGSFTIRLPLRGGLSTL